MQGIVTPALCNNYVSILLTNDHAEKIDIMYSAWYTLIEQSVDIMNRRQESNYSYNAYLVLW